MTERINVRRRANDVMVSVTQRVDAVTVYWQERVLGATPDTVRTAVTLCREKCAMLREGVET